MEVVEPGFLGGIRAVSGWFVFWQNELEGSSPPPGLVLGGGGVLGVAEIAELAIGFASAIAQIETNSICNGIFIIKIVAVKLFLITLLAQTDRKSTKYNPYKPKPKLKELTASNRQNSA